MVNYIATECSWRWIALCFVEEMEGLLRRLARGGLNADSSTMLAKLLDSHVHALILNAIPITTLILIFSFSFSTFFSHSQPHSHLHSHSHSHSHRARMAQRTMTNLLTIVGRACAAKLFSVNALSILNGPKHLSFRSLAIEFPALAAARQPKGG